MNKINFINEVKLELKVPDLNIPNNIRIVNGDLTLNEIEKKASFRDYIFDRGMSIRNLNKKLIDLQKDLPDKNSHLTFNLIKKSDKLIKDLEESEINFININGESCYQSASLQGFIHIIFPLAIKNLNKERTKIGKEKVKDLDELKNNSIFNNTIIETLKEIVYIQGCGNGGMNKNGNKRYEARKLYEIAPPILLGGGDQGSNNIKDIYNLHDKLSDESKQLGDDMNDFFNSIGGKYAAPPKKYLGIEYTFFTGKDIVRAIEINKKTIVSEVIKFKVEGKNEYYGNLVLKFNEDDLNDQNLDICKLIKNSPQIKKNNYSYRKIIETSDMIFMITDRLEYNHTIKKQFNVYENIYLDNLNGCFNYSININSPSTLFELKFVIFHHFYDDYNGHYIAYCKIRGKWHVFNDLDADYAKYGNPPLINNKNENYYPVVFYYVKNKDYSYSNKKILDNLDYFIPIKYINLNEAINPFETLGISEEECQKMNPNLIQHNGDILIGKLTKLKNLDKSNIKKLLLSYFLIFNKNKYERIGNTFKVNNKDHFYYVIMNDLDNLKKEFEQNKYIITQKDNFKRNLLHFSVIGEYFEISKFLLEKGINYDEPDCFDSTPLYYAGGKIKELLGNYGSKIEAYNNGNYIPQGLNIKYKDVNKIDLIYKDFLKNEIVNKMICVKKDGAIIGKRLIRATINLKKTRIVIGVKFIMVLNMYQWNIYYYMD